MAGNQLEALVGLVTRLDCDVKCELLDSQVRSQLTCVPDLDPPDLHVFGTPGSGSGSHSQRYEFIPSYHQAKLVRKTLIPSVS
jgi:hypothetical protein